MKHDLLFPAFVGTVLMFLVLPNAAGTTLR